MQKILGQKLLLVGFIGLVLWLPLLWISEQVRERQNYQSTVRQEVAASWTGAQTLMSPVIVIQYQNKVRRPVSQYDSTTTALREVMEKHQVFLPAETAFVSSKLDTEKRYKGIYSVPVYRTDVTINGEFSAADLQKAVTEIQQHKDFAEIDGMYIALHIADPRGVEGKPTVMWRGESMELLPGSGIGTLREGLRAPIDVSVAAATEVKNPMEFAVHFTLRGMETLQVLPAARQFTLQMESGWPHPEFSGAFLPIEREISPAGFAARWSVNEFSTGIGDKLSACAMRDCNRLLATQFGVNLFQSVDVYQQTERAIKYAQLFIALTFAIFFIFETLQRSPIHPIQYIFVGLALVVFYLLLLSLSEHLPFAQAYFIAGAGCCALNGFYVKYVMRGWRPALVFTGALASLYGVLFVILRMEDYAQLTGAVLIFAVLASAMMLTRKIDWYQINATQAPLERSPGAEKKAG